jgi:perosamine synthetase
MSQSVSRRRFVASAAAAGLGLTMPGTSAAQQPPPSAAAAQAAEKPALLGGSRTRNKPIAPWPVMDTREEQALLATLRSGKWFCGDGKNVDNFEQAYARLTGAKHCVATNGGTTALAACLAALGVGPGDEVIVTPYTFIASFTAIMLHHALPVLVDVDADTFLLDPAKIEAAITERTAAIMPVHIGGNVCNMDAILAVARKHRLPVVEDACQAHLAAWRGRSAGTWGTTGCFSFQVSKNLCSGEGGAILTDDDELAERIYACHNNCRARAAGGANFFYLPTRAANFRMTEFQGALLLSQMTRLQEQSQTRSDNAQYLTDLLRQIPGIVPAKMYEGCTRNAYHLYMFRYQPAEFANLPRKKFLKALSTEGISASSGYAPIAWEPFLKEAFSSRGSRRVFPEDVLAQWPRRCHTPAGDRLCEEAVWFSQRMLLGPRTDMDQIAEAIRKIHAFAGDIGRTI